MMEKLDASGWVLEMDAVSSRGGSVKEDNGAEAEVAACADADPGLGGI
jgi:hypothetical protein